MSVSVTKERSNPSKDGLTLAEVDDIVDRLLRGHYERKRPATPMEVIRAGCWAQNSYDVRRYVEDRWDQSAAGATMRTNNILSKASSVLKRLRGDEPGLVWKVIRRWTGDTICWAVGSREDAIGWAFTIFGWTRPGMERHDLTAELHGAGGWEQAVGLNMDRIKSVRNRAAEIRARIEKLQEEAQQLDLIVDTVVGASAQLASMVAGDAPTQDGAAA